MKKAIIVGSEGQDGKLLSDLLISKNYLLIGIDINSITANFNNDYKNIDITHKSEVDHIVNTFKPEEIYYLAAFHHSSEDLAVANDKLFQLSYSINLFGFINFIEAVKQFSPSSKLFYASSSLIFGNTTTGLQTETNPFMPDNIYGITKLDGLLACRYYRDKYNIFASAGILFNHESHFRDEKFLSKKIITHAINIANKTQSKLLLGNLNAEVDWGYAPDFVDAMHRILLLDQPDDFIIATGQKHSIKEFVQSAFSYLKLDWHDYVETDENLLTRKRMALIGDSTKLKAMTNWQPSVSFEEMIHLIIEKIKSTNG